jgi:MGT family glycosyltransferase
MYALNKPFITLVPGHPSQLPVSDERYGIPAQWPACLTPDPQQLDDVEHLADTVTAAFTDRWNSALASIAPERAPVKDAFRVHGHRVLYNSVSCYHRALRFKALASDHRFVGPLVRQEQLPDRLIAWRDQKDNQPQIYIALGTFLSHREDVLLCIAQALRKTGLRAAMAIGSMPTHQLGPIPEDWIVARELPQVAMLQYADLAIHHGGNNSVQECLGAGVKQLVLPFSTDQFANAADLENLGIAAILDPNQLNTKKLTEAIDALLDAARPAVQPRLTQEAIIDAIFE